MSIMLIMILIVLVINLMMFMLLSLCGHTKLSLIHVIMSTQYTKISMMS
jgi:hypothetical protein